jgi:ribonuclease BN (tRNA processing enzyme)
MSDHVRFLGSGDAFGSGARFQTCILVELGGQRLLLDCGPSSLVAMREQGVAPDTIDGIVITHLHGDHCAGVPFFLLEAIVSRRQRPLVLAVPEGARVHLQALYDLIWPGSGPLRTRFALHWLEQPCGEPAALPGLAELTLTRWPARHVPETRPTMVRVQGAGKAVAYTGDTEWCDEIVALADGVDLLVIECSEHERALRTHLNHATIAQHRAGLRAKRVVLTHMGDAMLARTADVADPCASDGLVIEL